MTVAERLAAALSDRYRIERELGAGGMATVYLAEDVRHRRKVALKVLHPELSAVLGPERFLKEIELTASLQHPHILPLFDSGAVRARHPETEPRAERGDGEGPSLLYYVMPFVQGETLRARLDRERQLSIAESIRLATEVADALAYAHGLGVIHRDIKPENILLQGGHALVADFGIALAVQQAGGQRMTQTGLSLGTPQYMAPEQATGEKTIDARADVYALGAVTYEMLVGEPPFTGPTAQAIVARLLTTPPASLIATRNTVPVHVEQAVLTALAKLPADRFATAGEFAAALASPSSITTAPQYAAASLAVRRARLRDPVVLGLGAAVIALAGTAAALATRRGSGGDDAFAVRTVITLDANGPIGTGVLSPDGHSVVYSGTAQSGNGRAYYIRRLDQLTAREIAGTEGSTRAPTFSPDGKWLAFIAGRRSLVKLPLEGGTPVTLASVPDYGGIAWSPSGQIIVGAGVDEGLQGLFRVSDAGGPLVPLTHIDSTRKELSHQQPRVLADGKTVLFTIWSGSGDRAEIAATSLDDGKVVPLGIRGVAPIGVIDDRLVYVGADGRVMAVPFDLRARRTSGTPTLVQDGVAFRGGGGADHDEVAMTDAGGLVYLRGDGNRHLVWVDRNGKSTAVVETPRDFSNVRLSPNGRQAALTIGTGAKRDIWTLDLAAGTLTPLTTTGSSRNPMWSADGQRILYASTQSGRAGFWWQPADGGAPPQLAVVPRRNPWNADLSPDGRNVVFNGIAEVNFDLESVSLDSTHRSRALSASPTAIETFGRFSPDGRWVAYNSDESGRMEVYVRPFAEGGGRVQISVNGGRRAIWGHDGNQLYYWEGNRLVSASLGFGPAPVVVSRTPLFAGRFEDDYDVSKDGRFLMIQSETSGVGLVVVPNWRTELRQLTARR